MAKVSFLGPVKDKAAWISSTIENLQEQTLEDVEFIFVDDGSTDDTPKIIRHYAKKDKRIKLHLIGENAGLGKAWNIGTKLVKSPIICVMSGDDWWVKERAEWAYESFKEHKNIDVWYGGFYFCDYAMNPREYKPTIPFSKKKLMTVRKDGFCSQNIGHFVMSYRTAIAKKVPYRADMRVGIDYPFIVDLIKAGAKFGWTKKILGYARLLRTGVSISQRQEVVENTKKVENEL